jgi:hypothetical protein
MLAELTAASCPHRRPTYGGDRLKWTGGVIEWVELIYALYEAYVINGGKITLKYLFRTMGEVFDFRVEEFSRAFTDIKNRVRGDRTTFLDRMKERLLCRIEDADRKPSRR